MFTFGTKVMGLLVTHGTARGSGRVRVFLVLPFPAHVSQWSHCCLCKPGLFLRSQATWLRGSQRPDAGRQGSVWDWVLTSTCRLAGGRGCRPKGGAALCSLSRRRAK